MSETTISQSLRIDTSRAHQFPPSASQLEEATTSFGKSFTPNMFTMRYTEAEGWHKPCLEPYGPLGLEPASLVLHYAQQTFEGMKAYAWENGEIALFRPEENARRINRSNRRLCIPEIPEKDFMDAIWAFVEHERHWVPQGNGSSLYLRPTVIATEAGLGVRASTEYLFFIIGSPSGNYFSGGPQAIRLTTALKYVRASSGGTGEAKTGGNYASSLLPAQKAKQNGFHQVIYLDAKEHRYLEELGGMNLCVVGEGNRVITPPLAGTILPGVTRDSILTLAQDLGFSPEERPITIDELTAGIEFGKVKEIFACGTAAVITPVGFIHHNDEDYAIGNGEPGEVTTRLYEELTGIQYGTHPDNHGWMTTLKQA